MATRAKAERLFPLLPQEGILQRLQSSVEQEESRWRVKLELSQGELKEVRVMHCEVFCFFFLWQNCIIQRSSILLFFSTSNLR